MARRRRQVKPKEVSLTLAVLVAMLLLLRAQSIPQVIILQLILWFTLAVILVAFAYYYSMYRRLAHRREGLRQLQLDDIDNMSGVAFEDYVAELFRRQGYKVQTTAISGDYGVDLIIIKDGTRTAVQAKRYSKPVNQAAVREVVAGMKHYKCTRSIVVTNNYFTRFAVDLAKTNSCILIDRDGLIEMLAPK